MQAAQQDDRIRLQSEVRAKHGDELQVYVIAMLIRILTGLFKQ